MPDAILVVLTRAETALGELHAAEQLSALLGDARISVLGVRQPARVHALEAEALTAEADVILEFGQVERARMAALKEAFQQWMAEPGEGPRPVAQWVEEEGHVAAVVGERGSRADVVVAGQPAEEDKLAWHGFRAALLGTDRPVLMVPPGWRGTLGRCVAIAWRDDRQSARAVIPALRCLAANELVHVLTGVRFDAQPPVLPRVLTEHGVAADLHVLRIGRAPFGQSLLEKAHDLGADLLVMGAFVHSPLRQLVFGGVTRYMLAHADLPVFMRH
jgi:nucleotide-binding universal stress UspA family protein